MLQIVNLKNSLRNVALGRAFVLQGGKWIQLNRTSPAAVAKILQYNTERSNQETAQNSSTIATRK